MTVPGAADSPGASVCNFAKAPAFTAIEGLVLAVLVGSDTSDAVKVALPAVLNMTLSVLVPVTSAAFAGKPALLFDDATPTVSVTFVTTFQFASTAFTVTLNAVPAVCAVGVPVLPP